MSVIRVDNFGPSAGGTTYSARGIAKAWVNFNGTGTIAARDSENVSSLTDNGTGDYTVNFSNAFGAGDYATTTSGARQSENDDFRHGIKQAGTYSTTAVQVFSGAATNGTTYLDANPFNASVFGDLA